MSILQRARESPLEWLVILHQVCQFQTKEGTLVGLASKSELRRWIQNGALHINGSAAKLDSEIPEKIESAILFPKSKTRKITLW